MYWRNQNWLGLGPAAAGHLGRYRYRNVPHLQSYLSSGSQDDPQGTGFPPVEDVEFAPLETVLAERILMGLRLAEGLDLDSLQTDAQAAGCGADLGTTIQKEIVEMGRLEVMDIEGAARVRLTETKGVLWADTVIGNLMAALKQG